jgi:hypothetical protein
VLVGRAALLPFDEVSPDGTSAVLAAGLQECALNSSSSSSSGSCPVNLLGGITEGMMQVNWRALLRDTAVRAVPDPAVQLELLGSPVDAAIAADAATAIEAASLPQQQQVPVLEQHAVGSIQPPPEAAPAYAVVAAPRRESAAVRHLKQACKQLQEAASIPVEVCTVWSGLAAVDSLLQRASIGKQDGTDVCCLHAQHVPCMLRMCITFCRRHGNQNLQHGHA